jgi:hypothetical protein
MNPHGSVRVVRMWCVIRTDPVLGCFNNSEGLNCTDMPVGVVLKLTSWLMA